ncbi:class I SAM-dependent methyltransferase [Falsibacillus albus]|uniref:Class I SAM-dependent methyltransferase n=1 Tax=Falsibacillus albus TaxID=2478915 RepID=A0A3L7JR68_9BACI|nr:class I SAM-dependent methyltransferase [Falsibacillus albus]RLQ93318.1 class I SAM-dependent methyltransferase [Falsibacillus albus]
MTNRILENNKKSWDVVAHHFNGVDALPSYGPFTQTEEELGMFGEITGKKVLDIGCGSGHSLKYMEEHGASELWGIDLSHSQIKEAENTLKGLNPRLFQGAMEEDAGLPKSYFDYVYSIYAIGWTTDLAATFRLIHSYLKDGGTFIFSWDHPLYAHLQTRNGEIHLKGSYQQEGVATFEKFKGEDTQLTLHTRKFATYINELINAGFSIDHVVESQVPAALADIEPEVSDRYYSLYKARKFPTTLIIKATKRQG